MVRGICEEHVLSWFSRHLSNVFMEARSRCLQTIASPVQVVMVEMAASPKYLFK